MKTKILILALSFAAVAEGQTDTLTIQYRDRQISVLSNSDGSGVKRVIFDDGYKTVKVDVDFQNELTPSAPITIEKILVSKHPAFKIKKVKPVYYTLDFQYGYSSMKNLDLVRTDWETTEGFENMDDTEISNDVMESRHSALHFGLEIPTKYDYLTVMTGIGIDAQKIKFNNMVFNFIGNKKGHAAEDKGYYLMALGDYYPKHFFEDIGWSVNLFLTQLTIPIEAKITTKSGWYVRTGLKANIHLTSRQIISRRENYSMFGVIYSANPGFGYDDYNVSQNLKPMSFSGTLGIGKGIFGLTSSVNISSMLVNSYKTEAHWNVNKQTFPHIWTFGIQLNLL